MLYCIVHCIVLYCIVLYCIVLYCIHAFKTPSKPKNTHTHTHTYFQAQGKPSPSKTTHVFFFKINKKSKAPFKNGVSSWCSWPCFFSSFSLCRFQSSGGIAGWAGARQLASEVSREWSAFVDLEITQDGAGCASVFDNKKIREIFSVVTMKWDHLFFFGGGG